MARTHAPAGDNVSLFVVKPEAINLMTRVEQVYTFWAACCPLDDKLQTGRLLYNVCHSAVVQ